VWTQDAAKMLVWALVFPANTLAGRSGMKSRFAGGGVNGRRPFLYIPDAVYEAPSTRATPTAPKSARWARRRSTASWGLMARAGEGFTPVRQACPGPSPYPLGSPVSSYFTRI